MKLPALVLLSLSVATRAYAAQSAIAVMPFHDLSGGKGSIGEAIRETVTSDLKEVGGMRVIERGNLDKVLAEQNLQAQKDQLDATTAVKVGKLVGASLIVAGAYQKSGSEVRLTARFVNVETSEIVGTAKVDGPQTDFLKLQDKITSQLLVSAGIQPKKVAQFSARPRPKVKNIRTIELYGDAVVEPDDSKRRALLQEAVNTDPDFVYASRDLDALEKRMRQYGQVAAAEQDQAARAELARFDKQIAAEKDPMKLYMAWSQLFMTLTNAKRNRTLIAACRKYLANPPPTPDALKSAPGDSFDERAQSELIRAYELYGDYDHELRECEVYLAKYSMSPAFSGLQMICNNALDKKRAVESGGPAAKAKIAALNARENSACKRSQIYKDEKQLKDALREGETCVKEGNPYAAWVPAFNMVWINQELAHFKEMRRWIEILRVQYPDKYTMVRHLDQMMPRED